MLVVFTLIQLYIWLFRGRGPTVVMIVALVLASHWWRGERPETLGFTHAGLGPALRAVLPASLAIAALILGATVARRPAPLAAVGPTTALAIFAGYCAWALVQQWALNGYFTNRLHLAIGDGRGRLPLTALLTAICFGFAHLPAWWLVGPTTVLGFLAALAYLRHRNLYALALAHGIVGSALVLALLAERTPEVPR